jgi:putative endonuclease
MPKKFIMIFYVYIIFSEILNKYYIGYTSNIKERIRKHNSNHKGFTGKNNDWKLKHLEPFDNKIQAILREKQIKNWKSRTAIERLIQQNNIIGSEHPDL